MYYVSIWNFSTKQLATCYFENIFDRDNFADNVYDPDHLEISVGFGDFGMDYEDYLCIAHNGKGYF